MSDWDAELKKIDRQLESMSDSALIPAAPKDAPPMARAQVATERAATRTWGAFLRLALATALGVGILFWPYPKTCGVNLAGYLVAAGAVTLGVVWSLVLAAIEVLPHAGYAKPDPARPAGWSCAATANVRPNILRAAP